MIFIHVMGNIDIQRGETLTRLIEFAIGYMLWILAFFG